MGSNDTVLFEVTDGVGVMTLNRPDRLNAVNWETAERAAEVLRDVRLRDEVRVIVLTGAGKAFCAGGNASG
jgi:enoyl-CoA hydratase/carnithine racemase